MHHHALADSELLLLQVVRALRQCFTGDSVGFLDEARFERLLPPLVAQLAGMPCEDIAPVLAAVAVADPPPPLGARLDKDDAFGAAVVGALTEMAAAARSDILWKPLNHAVRTLFYAPNAVARLVCTAAGPAVVSLMELELKGEAGQMCSVDIETRVGSEQGS